jgi:hypothetical protein
VMGWLLCTNVILMRMRNGCCKKRNDKKEAMSTWCEFQGTTRHTCVGLLILMRCVMTPALLPGNRLPDCGSSAS